MADDKAKTDARDRGRVAGGQEYEVRHFAEVNSIDEDMAKALIDRYGNDRERLKKEARKLRSLGP